MCIPGWRQGCCHRGLLQESCTSIGDGSWCAGRGVPSVAKLRSHVCGRGPSAMPDYDDPAGRRSESQLGKLIYTEFDSAPGRAEYALPPGTPALQGFGPEFDTPPLPRARAPMSRRRVLLLGLAGGISIGGMLAWGLAGENPRHRSSRRRDPMQPDVSDAPTQFMIDGARVVASKPIDDLVRVHAMYLWLVEHRGPRDEVLWSGVQRLARWALLDREHRGVAMARRLIPVLNLPSAPARLTTLRTELEVLVWEWNRGSRAP